MKGLTTTRTDEGSRFSPTSSLPPARPTAEQSVRPRGPRLDLSGFDRTALLRLAR